MKKIGVALGGGGARGIAHIAYLKAIEECGVKPCVISGTSSGSIAGALYAGGMSPDDMYALLMRLMGSKNKETRSLIRFDRLPEALLASLVKKFLKRVVPKQRFEDLNIPLKVVATDFHSLQERVFVSGDVVGAVMGSIALSGVFPPAKVDGAYYMDGGATNIVPFDIIRNECDVLIAIDVSMVRKQTSRPTAKNAEEATWAATQQALISAKLQSCPVEIFERPDFGRVETLDFDKFKSVYKRANELMPAFKEKLKRIL